MSRYIKQCTVTWSVPDLDHPDAAELDALSIELGQRLERVARLPRYARLWPDAL